MARPPAPPGADSVAQDVKRRRKAPDLRPGDDPDPRAKGADAPPLPGDCPVKALGKNQLMFYFLDDSGELVAVKSNFGKGDVYALFARDPDRAEALWPQWGAPKKDGDGKPYIKGLDQTLAQKSLIKACGLAGIFDPVGRVRGRGAHVGLDGEIMLHSGNRILIGGKPGLKSGVAPVRYVPTGLIDGYVYPAGPVLPAAGETVATTEEARALLADIASWNWRDRDIGPLLVLGYIALAMICGAPRWRSHLWIIASAGSGKTTLMNMIEQLLDRWLLRVEDATEAGIRQVLHHDTLALLFDELEPDAENDRQRKIIELARRSSSGSNVARGSSEHKGQQFTTRSAFLFTSILHPPLETQDRERIAVLQLDPLPRGSRREDPDRLRLNALGARMRRRMVEQWPRWRPTFDLFERAILDEGFNARYADQFGTLLTAADLLLHDEVPPSLMLQRELPEEGARVIEQVRMAAPLMWQTQADGESDPVRCLRLLTSYRLPAAAGREQESVGRWITRAMTRGPDASGYDTDAIDKAARDKLKTYGMRLVHARLPEDRGDGRARRAGVIEAEDERSQYVYLAVCTAGQHRGLAEIFKGTKYQDGGWALSLARVIATARDAAGQAVEAKAITRVAMRFDGGTDNAVLIPLDQVIDWQQQGPPPLAAPLR